MIEKNTILEVDSGRSTCLQALTDKEFLDLNGYVILRKMLSEEALVEIKKNVKRIEEHEGPRLGEHGYSAVREKLISEDQKISLWCFDSVFRTLRFFLSLSIRVIPQIRQAMSLYTRLPMDYSKAGTFSRELRQMLVCIVEQLDEPNDIRICDLVNKGEVFDRLFLNERVLNLTQHLIGDDYKLSSLNLRSPKTSNKNQNLHSDYPWAVKGNKCYACNALWAMDDMTKENGATRIIPGSHRWGITPPEGMENVQDNHSDQILVNLKAGDVLFVNSHVWHGGTANRSGKSRTIIQCFFVHRAHVPQQYQRYQIREATKARLSHRALEILDIYS